MDRIGILSKYARILGDAASWLSTGWSEPDDDVPIVERTFRGHQDFTNGNSLLSGKTKSELQNAIGRLPQHSDYALLSEKFTIPEAITPGTGNPKLLNEIAASIQSCKKCNLHLTNKNMFPGLGPAGARLMVICAPPTGYSLEQSRLMNPNEQEYLNKWLKALQLDPEKDVFITPALKCRLPGGRPPHPEETAACTEYLRQQYLAVSPAAILALGDTACGSLTGDPRNFVSLVAREWKWGTIPALVLWTPTEVLAYPDRLRRPVWESLQRLRDVWR